MDSIEEEKDATSLTKMRQNIHKRSSSTLGTSMIKKNIVKNQILN
jgi:hypothetical protein